VSCVGLEGGSGGGNVSGLESGRWSANRLSGTASENGLESVNDRVNDRVNVFDDDDGDVAVAQRSIVRGAWDSLVVGKTSAGWVARIGVEVGSRVFEAGEVRPGLAGNTKLVAVDEERSASVLRGREALDSRVRMAGVMRREEGRSEGIEGSAAVPVARNCCSILALPFSCA